MFTLTVCHHQQNIYIYSLFEQKSIMPNLIKWDQIRYILWSCFPPNFNAKLDANFPLKLNISFICIEKVEVCWLRSCQTPRGPQRWTAAPAAFCHNGVWSRLCKDHLHDSVQKILLMLFIWTLGQVWWGKLTKASLYVYMWFSSV